MRSPSLSTEPAASEAPRTIPETIELDAEALQLAELHFETTALKPLTKILTLYGQIEPNPEKVVNLNSRVTGRVLELRAHVGQRVRKGQILAILDSEEIHRAEVNYAQAKRKLAFAKAELERRRALARLGAYATPAFEEARTHKNQAEAELKYAETELRTAEQAIQQAEADLRRARTAYQYAESQLERAKRLLEAQLIAQQEYETISAQYHQTQADLQSAQARLEAAKAQFQSASARLHTAREQAQVANQQYQRVRQIYQGQYLTSKEVAEAEAQYAQAKLELEAAIDELHLLGGKPNGGHKLVLIAPFDGTIVELRVTIGETVTPDKPIFRLLNTQNLWVGFDLYPEDVPFVRVGMPIKFTVSGQATPTYTAQIQMIMPESDPHTRTVKARCVVDTSDAHLKPGAFVEGQLRIQLTAPRIVIPLHAVHELEGQTVVFVATDVPTRFAVRKVVLGPRTDTETVVLSGLTVGERIVVRNSSLLKGMLTGEGGEH